MDIESFILSGRNRMHLLAATLARYALVALPVGALDTYPRQPGVHVEHYVFALELSDASDEIRGEATVTIRFTKDGLTSFFLDLATPSSGKGMTTTAVVSDSASLRYTHTENRLTITLPRPSQASELRQFTVRYRGVPAGGRQRGSRNPCGRTRIDRRAGGGCGTP